MTQQQLESNILNTLNTLTWDARESELRASTKGFSLYVNGSGRVQIWKGSQTVMQFVSPFAADFHAREYPKAESEQLEELAMVFPDIGDGQEVA